MHSRRVLMPSRQGVLVCPRSLPLSDIYLSLTSSPSLHWRSSGNWREDGGYLFEQDYSCLDEDYDWEARLSSQLGSAGSEGRGSRPGSAGSGGAHKPAPLLLTCLVMEYCAGGTLNQAIQRGAFYRDGPQPELHEVGSGGLSESLNLRLQPPRAVLVCPRPLPCTHRCRIIAGVHPAHRSGHCAWARPPALRAVLSAPRPVRPAQGGCLID